MPKKPNYNFEKMQKERAREAKKNAKAEEKRLRKLAQQEEAQSPDAAAPDAAEG